jgi:predicted nucleic acid-binding protein
MVLVDSNIILDIWYRDPKWEKWSRSELFRIGMIEELAINAIVYAEVSTRYSTPLELDQALQILQLSVEEIPREAAFLAGKAFLRYRKDGGTRTNVFPDFFIGAHAAVIGCPLLTRDTSRYATYFPTVRLITP